MLKIVNDLVKKVVRIQFGTNIYGDSEKIIARINPDLVVVVGGPTVAEMGWNSFKNSIVLKWHEIGFDASSCFVFLKSLVFAFFQKFKNGKAGVKKLLF